MPPDTTQRHTEQAASGLITEQQFQKLVEVISRSQHNYRELIDNLDQAVFTLSLEGEVRVANRCMSELVGASFADLIGHRLDEFVAAPTFAEVENSLPSLLKNGSWSGTVLIRLKRDGVLRYFDTWMQIVTDENQVNSVCGWARDATAQYESQIRFNELFESLQEGIFVNTLDGRILDANPALIRLLGYDNKEDLQKRNFREVYENPADRDAIVQHILREGSIHEGEVPFRRKDGRQITCLVSGFAVRDAFGQIVRTQGTLVDVTEKCAIEKQLRHEQEFVRRLVASFPDLIAVLDLNGRFTYASQRMNEVLGAAPHECIGEKFGARSDPEDQKRLDEMFESVVSGREAQTQIEFRSLHRDGFWKILRASAAPLVDETGKISGVVASVRDVTETTLIEHQLAEKEKFTAMGQMMAGAAHELNNPLTAVLGIGELLQERLHDEASQRHIDLMLQQARRAAAIVQNLLAFARPPAQGRSQIQLNEIVQKAVKLHQPVLSQKKITVHLETTEDPAVVDADPKLLTQIFLNIIANAEQAISASRDQGHLSISVSRVDERIRVTFADDGPGILPANMSKIFDPFFTTKRPGGGTGLGLTICLAVVKDHGGTIEVQSTPGAGATFRLFLPVASESYAALPWPASAGRASSKDADSLPEGDASFLSGRTALVVDDEEGIREIIQEGLAARGMKVDTAESAESALSSIARNAYDVVLCDFNLPGLSGEKLFERVCQGSGHRSLRFVFITGELINSARVAAVGEMGATIVQKPFHVTDLAKLLSDLLQPHPSKAT